MAQRWINIQSILETFLEKGQLQVWIAPLMPSFDGNCLTLYAQNQFVADFVKRRYLPAVEKAAREILGIGAIVNVCVFNEGQHQNTDIGMGGKLCLPSEELTVSEAEGPSVSRVAMASAQSLESGTDEVSPGCVSNSWSKTVRNSFDSDNIPAIENQPKAEARPSPRPLSSVQLSLPMSLPPASGNISKGRSWRFSFEDFVVGPCNELAYAASHSLCSNSHGADVLYLASAPGLGKTHLMQAVGKMLTEKCNSKMPCVEYLTAEEFTSNFWFSIKSNDTDSFKSRYRNADILLIEDVHFLQGKTNMQVELLATLKALQERGGKVVLTSSFAPKDLTQIDEQLYSRLTAGLLSHIDRPDEETRRRIFRSKALGHEVVLTEEVESILARHINTDVRQIESCLRNLILKAKLYNSGITPQMAWEVIGNYVSHSPGLTMSEIIAQVCKNFGLNKDQLFSSSRKTELVLARNTAYFLARKHTDLSLDAIGKQFNRKHSTVIKGITAIEREMSRQSPSGRQMANAVSLIERNCMI